MAHPTLSPWLEWEAGRLVARKGELLIQQGRLQEERGLGEDVWELCMAFHRPSEEEEGRRGRSWSEGSPGGGGGFRTARHPSSRLLPAGACLGEDGSSVWHFT